MNDDVDRAPSFAMLLDWLEGRLEPEKAHAVSLQVAEGDSRVRGTVAWLQGFLELSRDFPLQEPPPIVRQRLRQHYARWSAAYSLRNQQVELVEATLLFDSREDLVLSGVRGDAVDLDVVHLAYTSDRADLVMDIKPLGDGLVRIDGQVLPVDETTDGIFEATLDGPGVSLRAVDGDESGSFSFDAASTTADRIVLSNGEMALTARIRLPRQS